MARVGRLAGGIIAESERDVFFIGNPKVPVDFVAAGFEPPPPIDARARPYIRLSPCRAVEIRPPMLTLDVEGEALAKLLAAAFVIERTGSISERLWRLAIGADEAGDAPEDVISARWLGELPTPIWQIVRDTVLRCS